jgi:myo-inositol-1(or 4)-monophosphatase
VEVQKIDWIKACRKIVSEAGKKILGLYTSEDKKEEIGVGYGGDITLKADKVAEDTIIEGISKLDVAVKLLSEEAGEISLGEEHEYTLIVDPLDGSFNFSTGVSYFGISIAVINEKSDTIAGYILDVPNRTEFYATQEGAFKDGKKSLLGKEKTWIECW